MRDQLSFVGAEGTVVDAVAIDLPFTDFDRNDVVLALEANGRQLSVRDRGPTWIIYPFSKDPTLDNEAIHARCVWQLVSLAIR